MTNLLQTTDLHRSYGRGALRFNALRGVSLTISDGEALAVVGKSGSGKSTLMHLLALLDQPTSGTIRLRGRDVTGLAARELNHTRNQTFGFVFQQFFLNPAQSVLDNVTLPLKIAGVPRRDCHRRGMATLEQLDLADKARNRATDLSGGQKQRTVIARALINEPAVIFADEPTGNLDSGTGSTVEDLLLDLNRRSGITLVVVTHDDELAGRLHRQVHIRDGQILTDTARATAYNLEELPA